MRRVPVFDTACTVDARHSLLTTRLETLPCAARQVLLWTAVLISGGPGCRDSAPTAAAVRSPVVSPGGSDSTNRNVAVPDTPARFVAWKWNWSLSRRARPPDVCPLPAHPAGRSQGRVPRPGGLGLRSRLRVLLRRCDEQDPGRDGRVRAAAAGASVAPRGGWNSRYFDDSSNFSAPVPPPGTDAFSPESCGVLYRSGTIHSVFTFDKSMSGARP